MLSLFPSLALSGALYLFYFMPTKFIGGGNYLRPILSNNSSLLELLISFPESVIIDVVRSSALICY